MTELTDTNGNEITLIKSVDAGGKLDGIIMAHHGGAAIPLDPAMSKALAMELVRINMEHDQADPGGRRDDDVEGELPQEDDDLMQNAFPWYPSAAQRALAQELVSVRYHGGDWQTAFVLFYGNAVHQQAQPQVMWALAEYCSEVLQSHGREEGSKRICYDLAVTRELAIQDKENEDG